MSKKPVSRRKKVSSARTPAPSKAAARQSSTASEDGGFLDKLMTMYENPALRHIVGGLAATALAKVVEKLTVKYPEVTNLFSGGLQSFEEKLADFKNGHSANEEMTSQH